MGFLNCIVSHEETEHKLWSHLPTLDGAPEDSKWAFLDNLATWLEGCQLLELVTELKIADDDPVVVVLYMRECITGEDEISLIEAFKRGLDVELVNKGLSHVKESPILMTV